MTNDKPSSDLSATASGICSPPAARRAGARRAGALGIGLLTGGIAREELQQACPYGVYRDPADLLRHLHWIAGRA